MSRSCIQPARHAPLPTPPPRRTAPFADEPGYFEPAGLWLYGNVRLLDSSLSAVLSASGRPDPHPQELDEIEREAEALVLDGKIMVTGIHNPAHQRAAVVPLRWGSPRILVLSGGFRHHLGPDLRDEPFRTARLWRFAFDANTDLVVSRRPPDRKPTFALDNPTVERLIQLILRGELPGVLFRRSEDEVPRSTGARC